MNAPFQKQQLQRQPLPAPNRRVLIFLIAGLILLLSGVTLIILNVLGWLFIPNTWISVLGVILTALGAFASLGQWLFPPSSISGGSLYHLSSHITTSPILDHEPELFRQQIEQDLKNLPERGALLFLATDQEVACSVSVSLIPQRFWVDSPRSKDKPRATRIERIRRHRVGNGHVCAAVFRDLDPDDYMVWTDVDHPVSIGVFAGVIATIRQQ